MTPRLALALAAAIGLFAGPAAATGTLTILHTNDVHARFLPVDRSGAPCDTADAAGCAGGTARLATAIDAARAAAGPTVLLDAGDQFQGSRVYTRYKGRLAAEMMTRLGYDAMAVGNHEFDDGPEVLRRFIDAVDFPVLSANTDVSGAPALDGAVRESAVITRGGARLGLIGLTPVDTALSSRPGPGVTFTEPVAAVQAEVDRLTAAGVDRIILLSHSGYDLDLRLARATRGVDVIVGGHSHTYLASGDPEAAGPYPTMVGDTAVVQAGAHGRLLGRLNVTFDAAGRVTRATGAPRRLDAGVAAAPEIAARLAAAMRPVAEAGARVIGHATAAITGGAPACRVGECAMGNLVADAMLAQVQAEGVDVALQNGGGLRASIDAGPVTMGEVERVLPFGNSLVTFEVTGATLRAALEHGVGRIGAADGRFPQVAGMRFAVDRAAPPGARLREVTVGGAPLVPGRVYAVVSNDFLRGGGDGYDMLAGDAARPAARPALAEVVAAHLAGQGRYTPYTDGRIRLLPR